MRSILVALALAGCTSSSDAERTLRSAGYTDVSTTGYAFFACSDSDTTATGFRAKNPRGEWVEGAVCCGLILKGCTVRF